MHRYAFYMCNFVEVSHCVMGPEVALTVYRFSHRCAEPAMVNRFKKGMTREHSDPFFVSFPELTIIK